MRHDHLTTTGQPLDKPNSDNMDTNSKKEILVGLVVTTISLLGLVWVISRLTDGVISSLSIILLFLILLLVFMNQLLPKKYRDALKQLATKEKEDR